MAVRSYNYDEAKSTMAKIQEEAGKVDKYLQNCDDIIKQNVGVEDRWSGQRANDFRMFFLYIFFIWIHNNNGD